MLDLTGTGVIQAEGDLGRGGGHISDETLEAYTLGRLSERELVPLEEHLLVCADCQGRLQTSDLFVAAMRHALRGP